MTNLTPAEYDDLTERLRALRLPDQDAVLISFGSVSNIDCGKLGAIQVTASKGGQTCTSEALRLEDALLMVCARLNEAIAREAERKAKEKEKEKQKETA